MQEQCNDRAEKHFFSFLTTRCLEGSISSTYYALCNICT